jgi:hypothetical protein
MATNFPTSLDSLTNPATTDQLNSPSHAAQHANANDAIEALEAKVGVDGSTVTTSHAYKIAQLESDIQNSAGDFIPLSVLGQPSGPAELNADGNLIVPENKIIIEGATADAHELTLQAPDVTSDITVTLPNASGTLALTTDVSTAITNLVSSAPSTLDTLNELATALGNDANFATTTATSIGNKVSKAGGDTITASSASVKPLAIKAASSQTANLMEFQNSSGTAITFFNASGGLTATEGVISTSYSGGKMTTGTLGYLNATTFTPSVSPVVVRGAASQTADLQEWQNSSGGVLLGIDSTGSLNIGAGSSNIWKIKNQTSAVMEWQPVQGFMFLPYGASNRPVTIKGAASQTGNLTEWQNSAGTVLTSVNSFGDVTAPGMFSSGSVRGGTITSLGGFHSFTSNVPSIPVNVTRAAASQTANLQEWQNSSGTVLAAIDSTGTIALAGGKLLSFANSIGAKINLYGGNYTLGIDDYTTVITADNNASNGRVGIRPHTATYSTSYVSPIELFVNGQIKQNLTVTNVVGHIIKAAASQTANLQEWQNAAGTVLSKVDSTGAMFTITPAANTNTNQVATTAYVQTELADLVNSAPAALDTLNELATALGNDASFSTTVTNSIALKAPLASPALTGTPTAPTATAGTNTTQLATTAFVKTEITSSVQPGAVYQTSAPSSPAVGQIWIDSDQDVTTFDSNIIRRKSITATAGQTVFTTDLPFIDGFEQVFFNGLLLLKTSDYTTSGGNTVTLTSAAAVSDIVEIVSVTGANSVSTYTQAETNALLAANTSVAPLSISANTTLVAKKRYFVTSASALTLTLPATPALNDEIQILDASGNASTYNITVARNGNKINGGTGNLIIDMNGAWTTLLYTGSTYGWKVG